MIVGKYSKVIRAQEEAFNALCRQMERIVQEKDAEIERLRATTTEDQIKYMADRFLGWKLPENFNPDGGVSFKKTFNDHLPTPMKNEPTGTNLFDAEQATTMVRYMVDGMPSPLSRPQHSSEGK